MDVIINLFVALHIVGIAALLGGFFAQMKVMSTGEGRMTPGMLHGAFTMLATGVILVGLNEANDADLNQIKLGVKLAVLVVVLGLVYVKRDEEKVPAALLGAVGGLTTLNIFLATVWT